jgi:hypothetical protein
MALLRPDVESSAARSGERFGTRGASALKDRVENRDLALVFLLGAFAVAGAAALLIVLT